MLSSGTSGGCPCLVGVVLKHKVPKLVRFGIGDLPMYTFLIPTNFLSREKIYIFHTISNKHLVPVRLCQIKLKKSDF